MKLLYILIFIALETVTVLLTAYFTRRREEKRLGEYQDKILRTQRDEVQNIYETMRAWRHDYHNHMQTIKAYYSLEQFEQMKDYLDHLEQDLDSIDIAIKTGNVSVDAILSSKLSLAKKKNIDVNVRAVVPASLPIKDVDLCVVLGNLIDNALDACDKMKETEQRFLRVYIGKYKQQLYLSVTNSTHEVKRRENRFLITDKYGNHGHGLRRIDTIVDQYGGYINRKNEPGVFVTEIILCTI